MPKRNGASSTFDHDTELPALSEFVRDVKEKQCYFDLPGQTSCVSCNAGFFVPSIEQTACQACKPGFPNDQEEANLCFRDRFLVRQESLSAETELLSRGLTAHEECGVRTLALMFGAHGGVNTVSQGFSPEEIIFTLSAGTHQDDLEHHSEIVSLNIETQVDNWVYTAPQTKVFPRMSASTVYQKADGSSVIAAVSSVSEGSTLSVLTMPGGTSRLIMQLLKDEVIAINRMVIIADLVVSRRAAQQNRPNTNHTEMP